MPAETLNLPETEAMLDRTAAELRRLTADNQRLRLIVDRLGISRPGACNAPSHVTPAQATRILGRSRTTVDKLILSRKLETETHWGVKLIPMAEIMRVLKGREVANG